MAGRYTCLHGILSVLLLVACSTALPPEAVEEARGNEGISAFTGTCGKLQLKRDCSSWAPANRLIEIDGLRMAINGSEDGHRVMVMAEGPLRGGSLPADELTREVNRRYRTARTTLESHGVSVSRVTAVVGMGAVQGYLLELDGNGYDVLLPFSKE
jgi:hypothetical protein